MLKSLDIYFMYMRETMKPVQNSAQDSYFGFQDQLLLNAGHKYCRMLQWEHSAIL